MGEGKVQPNPNATYIVTLRVDVNEVECAELDRDPTDVAAELAVDQWNVDSIEREPDYWRCATCCDTHRVTIWDDDDRTEAEPVHFTGCWDCNEDEALEWDDSRCPECGAEFEYPKCSAGCLP